MKRGAITSVRETVRMREKKDGEEKRREKSEKEERSGGLGDWEEGQGG